jgi:hypothetical protein
MSKVAPLPYDDRTVYSVASFNQGVAVLNWFLMGVPP